MTVPRIAIEAWAPEYGAPIGGMEELRATSGSVDPNVEIPIPEWRGLSPRGTGADDVLFVDGVRRIDARVWITGDDQIPRMGLCASYGAGSVRCNGTATVQQATIERGLFSQATNAPPLRARSTTYLPRAVGSDDLQDLMNGVQQRLRDLEVRVATEPDHAPADLVVVDGPLHGRQDVPNAIGYVKSHQVSYLPPAAVEVMTALSPGQRTPLFVTQTSWSRFSWYVRLPHGEGHPWAGIVRCEASADLDLEEARRLADLAAATLPRFASRPHKDGRAPQNLYPIAGLERRLRHHLGDAMFLYRQLRAAAG